MRLGGPDGGADPFANREPNCEPDGGPDDIAHDVADCPPHGDPHCCADREPNREPNRLADPVTDDRNVHRDLTRDITRDIDRDIDRIRHRRGAVHFNDIVSSTVSFWPPLGAPTSGSFFVVINFFRSFFAVHQLLWQRSVLPPHTRLPQD